MSSSTERSLAAKSGTCMPLSVSQCRNLELLPTACQEHYDIWLDIQNAEHGKQQKGNKPPQAQLLPFFEAFCMAAASDNAQKPEVSLVRIESKLQQQRVQMPCIDKTFQGSGRCFLTEAQKADLQILRGDQSKASPVAIVVVLDMASKQPETASSCGHHFPL